jgi:hypothetical protein
VIEVPVPSKKVLSYILPKPRNETNEFILANVRPHFVSPLLFCTALYCRVMLADGRVIDGMDDQEQQQ